MILVVMGVSGSGKTTIGSLLANTLGWEFLDGDDFHPPENVAKMSRGIPLTDEDRAAWLNKLAAMVKKHLGNSRGAVLACSALKQSYREILTGGDERVKFVYLKGDRSLIAERMQARPKHYMKPAMLDSQFETLEEPGDALTLDINLTPEEIIRQVLASLGLS